MKKTLLLSAFIIAIASASFAQGKMNFSLIDKVRSHSTETINVLIKGDINTIKELVALNGGKFKSSAGDIAYVSISIPQLSNIITNKAIQRIEALPHNNRLMHDTLLRNNNVLPVHSGQAPLTQPYDGTGIIIGIMDSGIDYTHPDFLDNFGKTRIKYLWDQTQPASTNTPSEFGYGQAWNNTEIDNGFAILNAEADFGHGTAVAGIAAGNGRATGDYLGVAPKADIIFVALDFASTTHDIIINAMDYIYWKADSLHQPCVINASVGDYLGSHDGRDLQAQYIKNRINEHNGRSFVASAGNGGTVPFHLGYTVTSDTNFTLMTPAANGKFYLEMFADTADFKNVKFSIGADIMAPVHSYRGKMPFTDGAEQFQSFHTTPIYNGNGDRIAVVESVGDTIGGAYDMSFRITPDSTDVNIRIITTGSGKFDAWSFNFNSANIPTLATMPDSMRYKKSDKEQTICTSFQCLDDVISVANYINCHAYINYDTNLFVMPDEIPGELFRSSSVGPTRDGRIKPDISAPGEFDVAANVLSTRPNAPNDPNNYDPGAWHQFIGGTSAAAPCVSGIAALYLQKNPNASAHEIKQAITTCTTVDAQTGSDLPNSRWGNGKANAFNALVGCSSGISNHSINHGSMLIYPNPSTNGSIVNIDFANIKPNDVVELKIINMLGALVKSIPVNTSSIELKNSFASGIYFCNLVINGQNVSTEKLVVTGK